MYMGRSLHIYIEHRNLKTRKTLTTSQFRYETFYYLWVKGFDVRMRDTHSFYSGFFICPPPQHVWHPPQRSPRASENHPSSPEAGLSSINWLFQNLPKSSAQFRCVTSFALRDPVSHLGLLWHLWVIRPLWPRTHINTCVNDAPK